MSRKARQNDFTVEVEGVGSFRFGHRTMSDEIKIQAEYSRMLDGARPTDWLALVAGWMATLKVLTVHGPDDWDLDSLDPLDDSTYTKLMRINNALDAKEGEFRGRPRKEDQEGGAGAVGDSGVLVSPEVQPDA